jgi:RimJ/RimL family protein N-acetyltransferase
MDEGAQHVTIEIDELGPEDREALLAFFRRIPEGDRTFFKENVFDPEAFEHWLATGHRLIARDGDRICGSLGIVPGTEWSSHVAEFRLVVDPDYRGRGVGRTLARSGMLKALQTGYTKLVVEAIADQESTIGLFNGLGFDGEALLRDHVRTRTGESRDLIVLAHFVDEVWAEMEAVGITEELE